MELRWPTALCFGLTLVMLYLLVRRTHGRVTAWVTVVAYFFMPRVFGHAHLAVTETPMVLMTILVVYSFLRGLESGWWAIVTGILFGVALATKFNAILLPAILLPWAFLYYRRTSINNVYAMLFLGLPVMVLAWPWLWSDTVNRFLEYLTWNTAHARIPVYYWNVRYESAPWHYPFVLTALALPLTTLFLFILGAARTFRSTRGQHVGLLYLWAALVPMLALMVSGAKYDGVRLFLPSFPFVAALAGIGGGVFVRIAAFFDRPRQRFPRGKTMLMLVLLAIVLDGGWAVISARPYYLAYFNSLIGGTKGALDKGMEITYWCEGLNREAVDQINDVVPDGSSIMQLAMDDGILSYYQKSGALKKSITILPAGRGPADYHLLQCRRALFKRPEWTLYEDYEPAAVFGPPGAPLFKLYKTGPEFENRWPLKPAR